MSETSISGAIPASLINLRKLKTLRLENTRLESRFQINDYEVSIEDILEHEKNVKQSTENDSVQTENETSYSEASGVDNHSERSKTTVKGYGASSKTTQVRAVIASKKPKPLDRGENHSGSLNSTYPSDSKCDTSNAVKFCLRANDTTLPETCKPLLKSVCNANINPIDNHTNSHEMINGSNSGRYGTLSPSMLALVLFLAIGTFLWLIIFAILMLLRRRMSRGKLQVNGMFDI